MPIETELWRARIGTFQGGRMSRALLKQNRKRPSHGACTATSGTAPQGSSINWRASIIAGCLMLAIIIFWRYSVKFKLSQSGDIEVNPGPTLGWLSDIIGRNIIIVSNEQHVR